MLGKEQPPILAVAAPLSSPGWDRDFPQRENCEVLGAEAEVYHEGKSRRKTLWKQAVTK